MRLLIISTHVRIKIDSKCLLLIHFAFLCIKNRSIAIKASDRCCVFEFKLKKVIFVTVCDFKEDNQKLKEKLLVKFVAN